MLLEAKLAIRPNNRAAPAPSWQTTILLLPPKISGENATADQVSPPCFCQIDAIETEHSFLGGSIWLSLLFNKMFQ